MSFKRLSIASLPIASLPIASLVVSSGLWVLTGQSALAQSAQNEIIVTATKIEKNIQDLG